MRGYVEQRCCSAHHAARQRCLAGVIDGHEQVGILEDEIAVNIQQPRPLGVESNFVAVDGVVVKVPSDRNCGCNIEKDVVSEIDQLRLFSEYVAVGRVDNAITVGVDQPSKDVDSLREILEIAKGG